MNKCVGLMVLVAWAAWLPCKGWAQLFPLYETVYRPPHAHYLVIETPHFEVIYQEGYEAEAREAAAILEAELPDTKSLLGVQRQVRMPVVINGFNDRSNGYVTSFPFKQELEGISLKGNRLSARYDSWMQAVAPHELAHAVQGEAGKGFGVGAVMRFFAPDVARAYNLTMPRGATEGVAVYRESRVKPGAGRLNASRFQMQFRAAMLSDDPWSLAQHLEEPAFTRPADRMYIGGANLFEYLAEEDSARFFRRVLNFHDRFPFLGYGVELWYGTGTRPRRLGTLFLQSALRREQARLDALGPLTQPAVVVTEQGSSYRRPRWLDDSTLVAYASGYDFRPGFYRIDAGTGTRTLLSPQRIAEDFYFSLSGDKRCLLFSRYVPDPFVQTRALAEAFELNVTTREVEALTVDGRVLAPVAHGKETWGLRNEGQFNQWVRIGADGSLTAVTDLERALFISLHPAPDGSVVALLNVSGRQGLFGVDPRSGTSPRLTPLILFERGSIYDAAWSDDGAYLLFSADPDGITNVYTYDVRNNRVLQLTNAPFGAFEASLSPDGRTLAYVDYQHEAYTLALIPFAPEDAVVVPDALVKRGDELPWRSLLADVQPDAATPTPRPYQALTHLAPRMIYPTLRFDAEDEAARDVLGLGLGATVQGADPLERWAYGAEAFYQANRLWGRATLRTGRYRLRPSLSVFDLPAPVEAAVLDEAGEITDVVTIGREERGASLGVRLPVTLASNVYSTTAQISLSSAFRQERLFDADGETLRPFRNTLRLTPAAVLGYRLQANPRDLMPNTGLVLSMISALDVWREQADPRRALLTRLDGYLPLALPSNTGLRLQAGLLWQNRGSIFSLDSFLPRGYDEGFLGDGTFLRLGAEVVQPLWYIDDGFVLAPLYFEALYAFGFGERVQNLQGTSDQMYYTAAGAGLGLHFRFFYALDMDLRLGATYLFEQERWDTVLR